MKFKYKGQIITAASKVEAVKKITSYLNKDQKQDLFDRAKQGDLSVLDYPNSYLLLTNNYGNTPVHCLARKGVLEIINLRFFSKNKKVLFAQNKLGQTPIHILAELGIKQIINLPEEFLKIRDNAGQTPAHYLAAAGVKCINSLPPSVLSILDKNRNSPLDILRMSIKS
jgi:hypothetical protein